MNEIRRQEYLDILGIESFIPRLVLPAAKPSLAANLPVYHDLAPENDWALENSGTEKPLADMKVESEQGRGQKPAAKTMPAGGAAVLNSILGESDHSRSSEKPSESPTSVLPSSLPASGLSTESLAALGLSSGSQSGAKPSHLEEGSLAARNLEARNLETQNLETRNTESSNLEAPSFTLAIWPMDGVLIVDVRKSEEALPFEALLENILLQANLLRGGLPRSELLHWPVRLKKQAPSKQTLTVEEYEQQWSEAKDMIQGFVESRTLHQVVDTAFIFGSRAAELMGASSEQLKSSGAKAQGFTLAGIESCIVLPSLSKILREPQRKREVWLAIQNRQI